jgi:queuine/archaeosine tRNA-ribosyltransferase
MSFIEKNCKSRKTFLPARGKALRLPIYFPSISSVKTGLSPYDYYKVLQALGQPHFLVSAYDIEKSPQKEEFVSSLKENHEKANGPIILMDSGNYESFWLRDKTWTKDLFDEVLAENVSDLAFSYDNQFPSEKIEENVQWIAKSALNSQQRTNETTIIPIIHSHFEKLTETVLRVHHRTNTSIVSIPERILGDGLLKRIETVTNLRKELNKLDNYVYIHLLGTGNPFSLLLFSLAGADSFDGLEWCQTTINANNALLYHFQQRELIKDDCAFCKSNELDYNLQTLGHNLLFYNSWMNVIQESIEKLNYTNVLIKYFDEKFIASLTKIWS